MGLNEHLGIDEAARARLDELLAERAHESGHGAWTSSTGLSPRRAGSSANERGTLPCVIATFLERALRFRTTSCPVRPSNV